MRDPARRGHGRTQQGAPGSTAFGSHGPAPRPWSRWARDAAQSRIARETLRGPAFGRTLRSPAGRGTLRSPAGRGTLRGPAFGRTLRSQQGQALYEYALALPAFALLLLFVGAFAWFWWNQSVAAVAIHDGVRATAAYGGAPEDGMAVVEDRLYAALGAIGSAAYDGHFSITAYPQQRSIRGSIDRDSLVGIPFLGPLGFRVRAFSFQRDWAFYGGPGSGWD